jgi:uncharacterized damage-inducible protein DinB
VDEIQEVDEVQRTKKKLTAARERLLSAVDGLDKEQWEWRPDDGRWSVRLVLAHVGAAQWSHLEVARRLVAGQTVEIPDFDLDAWNQAAVAKRADWSVEQVLADLDAGQRATFEFLDGLVAEKLAIAGSHPALGEMNVGQVVRVIGLHDGLHRRDVLRLRQEMGAPG